RAHLIVAREAADRLHLDRVLFVPAANPPWKETGTPYADRYRMVELACAADKRFAASDLENRPGKNYTIETIELARQPFPGELFFIIGADAFAEVGHWHRAADLLRMVEFIVVTRPGAQCKAPEGAKVHWLDTLALEESSSEIRAALARGERPEELPDAVA